MTALNLCPELSRHSLIEMGAPQAEGTTFVTSTTSFETVLFDLPSTPSRDKTTTVFSSVCAEVASSDVSAKGPHRDGVLQLLVLFLP